MASDILKNKPFWYGVGTSAGLLVMFGLGIFFGPALQNKIKGNATPSAAVAAPSGTNNVTVADPNATQLAEAVVPSAGITLPIKWGDLGKQLVEKGVIDRDQFIALYQDRFGFGPNEQKLLDADDNGKIVMTPDNAGVILNLLWALGLGNKNVILESGPMTNPQYGGAGNFASTGGWSLARGAAMDHYSQHEFIKLNSKQQALVEKVSQGIFRPCCNNSVYFPDCNHGMAMLALLELMASQGAGEEEMYRVALQVNAYWFPDTYLTLAKYMGSQGVSWNKVDPKQMLSAEFSSASGYRAIKAQTQPVQQGGGGGGCGV